MTTPSDLTVPVVAPTPADAVFSVAARVPGARCFAMIDAAASPEIYPWLQEIQTQERVVCLYSGRTADEMADVAPYLLELNRESEATRKLFEEGWERHWFTAAATEADSETLRRHLRKFNMAYNAQGDALMFRYYDPRVIRMFLASADAERRAKFFGEDVFAFVYPEGRNAAPVAAYAETAARGRK